MQAFCEIWIGLHVNHIGLPKDRILNEKDNKVHVCSYKRANARTATHECTRSNTRTLSMQHYILLVGTLV